MNKNKDNGRYYFLYQMSELRELHCGGAILGHQMGVEELLTRLYG